MEYRNFGNSDLTVSAITFGAWAIGGWMWGGADSDEAIDAMEAAIDNGITTIDTAPVYGFGQSEELVGQAIKGKRDQVQILTKYGLSWIDKKGQFYFDSVSNDGKPLSIYRYSGKESIIRECEASLKRLGTDYIDLYQIHWADPTTPIEETMEAMNILQQQGKILNAGVCNYDVSQVAEALDYFPIISNQVPYSMVNRSIEDELVPYCFENNIGILAYSPLQRGILTGKMKAGHQFGEGDSRPNTPYYKEPNFGRILSFVDTLRPIADNHGATVGQVVINWTLQQFGITSALVGARNRQQVLDNVKALDFMLSIDEICDITASLDNIKIEK
ncbi:MAG: aldo/keto reductase [Bacteroidota bacterium]|nr:aldo/keto reductase [Bacteroidota bacterium]